MMMLIRNPGHPMWALIRAGATLFALWLFLKLTASNYDETEQNTLYAMCMVLLVVEGGLQLFKVGKRGDKYD